jgi:hypothetical protein
MILAEVRNVGRSRTADHFASYNATAPVWGSGGEDQQRHLPPIRRRRRTNRREPGRASGGVCVIQRGRTNPTASAYQRDAAARIRPKF